MTTHWTAMAGRWDAIGPPLRPSPADVAVLVELADGLPPERRRCLVLGATSELAVARWPEGTEVIAIDRSADMVAGLWDPAAGAAVLGDWRHLPLGDASVDLAVCDGGWHLLDRERAQGELAAELARVVRPGGAVAVRAFVPAQGAGDVAAVLAMLDAGDVQDANHLKVLLWMAGRGADGAVAVAEVWDALTGAHPDLAALADRLDWPPATLLAFDAYRGSQDRYDLVDEATIVDQLRRTGAFALDEVRPGSALAPDLRFPTLVVRRRR